MLKVERSLLLGAGVWALCASPAIAQDGNVIGPPQLRDFQLQPQERIVTQPAPPPQPAPVQVTPPSPVTTPAPSQPRQAPPTSTNRPAPSQPNPTQQRPAPTQPAPGPAIAPPTAAPAPATTIPPVETPPADVSPPPVSIPAPEPEGAESGSSIWLYALPVALLALVGVVMFRRRRRVVEEPVIEPVAVAAPPPPPKPRAEPIARPWIELELRTERATFNANEANVQFELEIRNTGKSPARDLRIDVKMFNAGAEQDKEIGAFFRTAGRDAARLKLPGIAAGASGTIRGEVGIKREEMKAVMLDDRMLFIPVVAVNALYECGDGRTGQSSKSYVVGRELQTPSEKMGAFRVDQGPRIWRTVGQRPHKLARRV